MTGGGSPLLLGLAGFVTVLLGKNSSSFPPRGFATLAAAPGRMPPAPWVTGCSAPPRPPALVLLLFLKLLLVNDLLSAESEPEPSHPLALAVPLGCTNWLPANEKFPGGGKGVALCVWDC